MTPFTTHSIGLTLSTIDSGNVLVIDSDLFTRISVINLIPLTLSLSDKMYVYYKLISLFV